MTEAAEDLRQDDTNIIRLDDKRPKPKLAPAGIPPETTYWLADLPEGWGFLTREKATINNPKKQIGCLFMQVVGRTDRCTRLYNGDSRQQFWVHTNDFSMSNERLDVIPIEYPIEEVKEDASGNRTDNSGMVVDPEVS